MKIFIGPQQRQSLRNQIESDLKRVLGIVVIIVACLPIIVFSIMKWTGVSSNPDNDGGFESVAHLQSTAGDCSAFLVSDKHLITAAHCLDFMAEGDRVNLTFKDNPNVYVASILYIPSEYDADGGDNALKKDYAILELENATFSNYYKLQLNTSTQLTDPIIVAGYPGGVTFSAATGTITGLSWRTFDETLQIMAGAWPGNSGGPVIDKATNRVIGILNAGDKDMAGMLISLKIDVLGNDIELAKKVSLDF